MTRSAPPPMQQPLIITAAITGGGPAGAKTPHLPATPRQIAAEAVACWRAGAAVVHFHGRLEDGTPTADPQVHRWIVDAVRSEGCDVILNVSAGDGGGRFGHAQRLALLDIGADMASFTAGSYNSGARLYDNRPGFLLDALGRMRAHGLRPEIEVLDFGFLDRIAQLVSAGELTQPMFCLFGFGIPGGMPCDPELLRHLLPRLPEGALWGAGGVADPQASLQILMAAFVAGGHVRCGMEDCPWLRPGELASSNAQLVEQWVATARIWGRPVADCAQARRMLGITPR